MSKFGTSLIVATIAAAGAGVPASYAQFAGFLPDVVTATADFTGDVIDMDTGDVDGDGVIDIVYMVDSGRVAYFSGAASGQVSGPPTTIVVADNDGRAIELFDFDNDGDLDLMRAGGVDGGSLRIYENDGAGFFSFDFAVTGLGPINGTKGVAMGDYDNDGDMDAYVLTDTGVTVVVNTGGMFSLTPIVSTFLNFQGANLAVADVDGDGRADAAAFSSSNDQVYLLEAGVNGLTDVGRIDFFEGSSDIKLFDIDQDGDADLVLAGGGSSDGVIRVFRNDGAGNFSLAFSLAESLPDEVEIADMNADGFLDIVVEADPSTSSATAERIVIYLNNGAGVFNRDPVEWFFATTFVDEIEVASIAGFSGPDVIGIEGSTSSAGQADLTLRINATPFDAPAAFDLLSPPNGASGLATSSQVSGWGGTVAPFVSWTAASGFDVTYHIAIAEAATPNSPVFTGSTTERRLDVSGAALDGGTSYVWTVTATNSAGQTLAANGPFSFATADSVPLSCPDIDGNGAVDGGDLLDVINNFGATCSP